MSSGLYGCFLCFVKILLAHHEIGISSFDSIVSVKLLVKMQYALKRFRDICWQKNYSNILGKASIVRLESWNLNSKKCLYSNIIWTELTKRFTNCYKLLSVIEWSTLSIYIWYRKCQHSLFAFSPLDFKWLLRKSLL